MSTFVSPEVLGVARQTAEELIKSDAESIEIKCANTVFVVSRAPLGTTLWQFDHQGEILYLALKE